ncbi:hypothetical protein PsYK624_020180 [Phanerochaete sordida]|uniref:Copper acquisition factor BIM1-like domain-containing protein n=1 Tax=Phanerochaete sordida TaxID=48140 RepID=A0A9P3FZ65_9APHY|nr:hypothetical protein PsYK624_020180 [Phanerochaete sordida]
MYFSSAAVFAALLGTASAHFQMQYPLPRGPFVESKEPTFCDGYTTSVSNRTVFPLSGGSLSLNSEHPTWTFGVQLSTLANPQSFGNFSPAVPFFQVQGEGAFCFPIDLAAANLPGVQDGANVTLQFTFDGGDGELFQCADLTLSASAPPASISCTNATGDSVQTLSAQPSIAPSSSSSSSSSTTSAPAQTSSSAASANAVVGFTGLFGLLAVFASL